MLAHPEVGDLERAGGGQQQVGRLDVPVDDAQVPVQVVQPRQRLQGGRA